MPSTLAPITIEGLPPKPVSRLAPTPNGFLHLGNAVNFLVTWALVRRLDGVLYLRIDDMDGARFRKDALEDIFESLKWLGLDWDLGPEGPDDFTPHYSLRARKAYYWQQLIRFGRDNKKTYACTCSRKEIRAMSTDGIYPGTCRESGHAFVPGKTAVRLRVDNPSSVRVNGQDIVLSTVFGDFVLWRKDDQPSYQLASLLEDEKAGTSLIVRGQDLLVSTAAQRYMADLFGLSSFPACKTIHHDLVLDRDGIKLSKSRGSYALKDIRESGKGPEAAFRAAAKVLGLPGNEISTARDLLDLPLD